MLACVVIPNLSVQIEAVSNPGTASLLIVDQARAAVVGMSDDVRTVGVQEGMLVYRAQHMAPWAVMIKAQETGYHDCHDQVAAHLQSFSNRIETVALGEFLLDLTNVKHDAGETQPLLQAILQTVRAVSGLSVVRVGLAANRFTAQQAAQRLTDDDVCIVPVGQEARFLAPLSVTVLPDIPDDVLNRLALLGIRTLDQFARLSQSAVVRQFGKRFAMYHDLARGRDPRAISPDMPPLRVVRDLRLNDASLGRATLEHAVMKMCERLAADLERGGYQAESIRLLLTTIKSQAIETSHILKPPTADRDHLVWLGNHLLDDLRITTPVQQLTLVGYPIRPWHLGVEQLSLFDAEHVNKRARLDTALRSLRRRYGASSVKPATALERPKPVPIPVIAQGDGTPLRVRLKGYWRGIETILEHWKIETGWWHQPICQDCYQVLTTDGVLLNLLQDIITGEWFLDRRRYVL